MSGNYVTLVASGLLTGVLSVLFGGISGWLAGREKTRQALDAWRRSREDRLALAALKLIQQLAQALASNSQASIWLTWRARYSPERLAAQSIDEYEYEVHERLPKVLGMHTALCAVSADAARQLGPVIAGYMRLDAEISSAGRALRAVPVNAAPLAALHDRALEYQSALESAFHDAASQLLKVKR
jgi:hypothetical protein